LAAKDGTLRSTTFFSTFAAENGSDNLVKVWNGTGMQLPEEDRMSADGLSLAIDAEENYRTILITFPQPTTSNECHYVVAITPITDNSALRLFGLEMAEQSSAFPNSTAIVEWTKIGRNTYFKSSAADQAEFLTRIRRLVSTSENPKTSVDLRPYGWFANE
jgi:hypothetical protein